MRLLPAFLLVGLCSCGSSRADPDEPPTITRQGSGFDEDRTRERVADDLSGESFESVGDTSTCTEDCSGHEAGFDWARDHGVTDSSECGGTSQSFEEGCQAYADALEERTSETESDDGGDGGDGSDELS